MEPTWSSSSTAAPLPITAIRGGHLFIPTYVGRVEHNGLILAAAVAENRSAYIAWEGRVHRKTNFDILTGDGYKWLLASDKEIPDNAVKCCETSEEGALYIGRTIQKDSLIVGTIHERRKILIASHENRALHLKNYEILVYEKNPQWHRATFQDIPLEAVVAGRDTDNSIIYVGRAKNSDEWLPAKVIPNKTCCYMVADGKEIYSENFEILCGTGYIWRKPMIIGMPVGTVYSDISKEGKAYFIGRANYKGSLTPGMVDTAERCLYLPYGGRAVRVEDYEVLVKQ